MGCDIQMYSETLIDDEWVADNKDSLRYDTKFDTTEMAEFNNCHRNYWFFALLAQVRHDCPWGFEAKGFPSDASDEIERIFKEWGSDAHTPSYLTHQELLDKYNDLPLLKTVNLLTQEVNNASDTIDSNLITLKEHINTFNPGENRSHQRIVFWFDN